MRRLLIVAVSVLLGVLAVAPQASASTWAPTPGAPWQWVLQGNAASAVANPRYAEATAWDIDGFDNPASTVAAIHAGGDGAVCYISGGTWENWRPDAASFPASVKGKGNGWAGEKWLDIRQVGTLRPIMEARAQMCADKGFDAVEWDNVDGYANSTGFPLTGAQQITYNRMLADVAHAHGMRAVLKNDIDQLAQLQPYFDFALNEECARYSECSGYSSFVNAGKAVWNTEYRSGLSFCSKTYALFGRASIRKTLDLNADPFSFCTSASGGVTR